jgi:hypothetical protein
MSESKSSSWARTKLIHEREQSSLMRKNKAHSWKDVKLLMQSCYHLWLILRSIILLFMKMIDHMIIKRDIWKMLILLCQHFSFFFKRLTSFHESINLLLRRAMIRKYTSKSIDDWEFDVY